MQYDRFAPPFRRIPRRRRLGRRSSTQAIAIGLAVAGMYAATARAQDAAAAGPPANLAPPTAAAGGWSAWTPVAGQSFLSPSLALNPAAGTLEVASVGLDLNVIHCRVSGSSV